MSPGVLTTEEETILPNLILRNQNPRGTTILSFFLKNRIK
jgi:hypothetical protein